MGDHRPKITADFEMHGHKAHYDFGWCNWSDNGSGIDQRIVDWFSEQAEIAMMRFDAENQKYFESQNAKRKEEEERRELSRLKEKYEDKKS